MNEENPKVLYTVSGGPIVKRVNPVFADCTGAQDFYDQMDTAVKCVCNTEDDICSAMAAGRFVNTEPIKCIMELLTGEYSKCGASIPENKIQDAYKTFVNITGIKPIDINKFIDILEAEQVNNANINSIYMFLPILIFLIIGIWVLVGLELIGWVNALFATIFGIIVIYVFIYTYRAQMMDNIINRTTQLRDEATKYQTSHERGIAYMPVSLFAVACSLNGTSWPCEEKTPEEETVKNTE